MNQNRKSIIDMAQGAIKERADYETPTKKRTLTLQLVFSPDSERRQIGVAVTAKSKLEPTNPVGTALYLTGDGNGELTAVEMGRKSRASRTWLAGNRKNQQPCALLKAHKNRRYFSWT